MITPQQLSEAMAYLGLKGKGRPKNFTPEELAKRTQRLAAWREKQTTKTKDE